MTSSTTPGCAAPALQLLAHDAGPALALWRVDLDAYAAQHCAGGMGILSADERERAERFAFEHLRRRSLASRHALRRVLGERLGRSPQDLPLAVDRFGKPSLADDAGLQFSLSHREQWALIGVQRGAALGVDIELVRPLVDLHALAQALFSSAELGAWQRLETEAARSRFFFTCWTRKEACVKALGIGMSAPLQAIDVGGVPDDATLRLASSQGELRLEVRSLDPLAGPPGTLAACAWADAGSVARAHAAWG